MRGKPPAKMKASKTAAPPKTKPKPKPTAVQPIVDSAEAGSDEEEEEDPAPPPEPFRFLDLPYELRLRIYELILVVPQTIDLDPQNYRTLARNFGLFYASARTHAEATRVFYARNTFRLFPLHGRFFHTKYPLLTRLPPRYRAHITTLELRLGPGWTKPPRCWVLDARLGLADMAALRTLKVFVECDPASHPVFEGFRVGEGFYTEFCVELLRGICERVDGLRYVELDAYPAVERGSPLLSGLVQEARGWGKRVVWGSSRAWEKEREGQGELVALMGGLGVAG